MADNNKKNNFVMQAGILAAAGIISRVIGLLYRKPLTSIIHAEGNGYFTAAHNFYAIVLLISSYSIPSAISKVIAQKLAVREYRNAHRIFHCALLYVTVVGGAASLLLFFGAGIMVSGPAVPVLKVFAPTVFFSGLLGVLRGYFQAHKTMIQTSVSQILEQIVNAIASVGMAALLIYLITGTLDMPLLAEDVTTRAMYGAIGSAAGTGISVVAALLFVYGIYILNRKMIRRRIENDQTGQEDSYGEIIRMIISVVTPFLLSTAVYNLSTIINQSIYIRLVQYLKEVEYSIIYANYGVFSAEAVVISNIPIAFASAMASAMIPQVAQAAAQKNMKAAQDNISVAVKTTMLIAIPSAVGLFVLAEPVTGLLFPQAATIEMASLCLKTLALSIVFYSLSTLSNSILQGMGKVNIPIITSGISLAVQTAVCVLLLYFTELDIYSLAISMTVYSGLICLLNQIVIRKVAGYRQELLKTFVIPTLASGIMGVVVWGVYKGLYMLTSSRLLSVVPSIVVAVCIYFAALIGCKGVTEEELRGFPKGHLMVKIARKCRLLS